MLDYTVSINTDRCYLCEECIAICTEQVFELDETQTQINITEAKCTGCMLCSEVCSVGALDVDKSLEQIKAERIDARKRRERRKESLKNLLQSNEESDSNEYKIPLATVLEALEFRTGDELEEWFIYQDQFIVYIDDNNYVVITTFDTSSV